MFLLVIMILLNLEIDVKIGNKNEMFSKQTFDYVIATGYL